MILFIKYENKMRLYIAEIDGIKASEFNLYVFVYFGVNEHGIIVRYKI